MRGTFPPCTPTLSLDGDYKGNALRAECYFGSVLSERIALVGVISTAVQSANSKTSDTRKPPVGGQPAATLYF